MRMAKVSRKKMFTFEGLTIDERLQSFDATGQESRSLLEAKPA
jgi:hypothetical protein